MSGKWDISIWLEKHSTCSQEKIINSAQTTADLDLYYQYVAKFIENDLISQHQPGFKPGDFCNIPIYKISEIYQSFDEGLDVCSVFLDISKTFDKVWHNGIIFRLQQNGIYGNLLNLLSNFLRNRKQRVVLNG